MRIAVEQPVLTRIGGPETNHKIHDHEGWVKWRDDDSSPWAWVYTRGC